MSPRQIYEDGKCNVKGGNLLQGRTPVTEGISYLYALHCDHLYALHCAKPLCTALQINVFCAKCAKSNIVKRSAATLMHSTAKYLYALHWTKSLCTALHCTAQNLYALRCTKSNKSQVSCPPLHLNTQQYTPILCDWRNQLPDACTEVHCRSMYFVQRVPNQILRSDQLPTYCIVL